MGTIVKSFTFLFLLLCIVFTLSCKKAIITVVANNLFGEEDLWRHRTDGIFCDSEMSTETFIDNELTFETDHIFCIDINMKPTSFEKMRHETRFGPSTLDNNGKDVIAVFLEYFYQCDVPWPKEYNWYIADITIDGEEVRNVGIRKKGFLGSVFTEAPSVKIKTDHFHPNSMFGNTSSITLNNNIEDQLRIKSTFNYKIFELVGYPAPRCNLANLSINDYNLGCYSHLEPIDDVFLKRSFGNNTGHLYEGQLVDFVERWLPRWDKKTNNTESSGAPLLGLSRALQVDSLEFIQEVEKYLDIDRFIQFWALEIILEHVDGYTSNKNNFYTYINEEDGGRATLIPWGMNYFYGLGPEVENEDKIFRFLKGEIPRRFSAYPELTEKLETEIWRIMDEVWDEDRLIEFVEKLDQLSQSAEVPPNHDDFIESLKRFIVERRMSLELILENGIPVGNQKRVGCTG